jgi:hypothetical protein
MCSSCRRPGDALGEAGGAKRTAVVDDDAIAEL